MSRDSDLGWAAGIIDGEGCISLYKSSGTAAGRTYVLRVMVGNTSLLMLKRLREILGVGNIVVSRKAIGKYRPQWAWQASSKQAEAVLRLLEPYLVNKREEAIVGLESRRLIRQHGINTENPNMDALAAMSRKMSDLKRGATLN